MFIRIDKENFLYLGEISLCLLVDGKGLIEDWVDLRYKRDKRGKDIKVMNRLR